jgi:pyruvate dehydrogenase E1 component alpha subunit
MDLDNQRLIDMYKTMVKIRQFEEKLRQEYHKGNLSGMLHLSVGEEAIASGACAALRKNDYITSNHRGHGHCIAKGGDLKLMIAEILGKEIGYCKGKGGSMHIADPSLGIIGANGIVGGGIPIATGCALSCKLRKENQVTLCFFGDGASNQGSFHESLNLASVWKLPAIYICENNLYAVSTHQSRQQNITNIADRASSYNIPGYVVDGNDVIAVYEIVCKAVDYARKGDGPSLIECKTYRWYGHCEADPPTTTYRTIEEEKKWKEQCPINKLEKKLIESNILNRDDLKEIDKEVKKEIESALEFAKSSPEPLIETALEGVFSNE